MFFTFTILCLAKYVVPRTGGATVPHFVTACSTLHYIPLCNRRITKPPFTRTGQSRPAWFLPIYPFPIWPTGHQATGNKVLHIGISLDFKVCYKNSSTFYLVDVTLFKKTVILLCCSSLYWSKNISKTIKEEWESVTLRQFCCPSDYDKPII